MRGFSKRLCGIVLSAALAVGVLPAFNDNVVNADSLITLSGTCHVQDYGDTEGKWDASTGTLTLGTRGQAKRVEAITINMVNDTGYGGTLKYRVHVQDIGWQDYRYVGEMAGTSGMAKRLEGIEMELEGDIAAYYTVEYAVHIQDYGDAQGWVADGTLAGTTGESKRLEEVQVRIVPRYSGTSTTVNYRVHVQDYGWESSWKTNGQSSGTMGEAKRLEGIEIHLSGNEYAGGIQYKTHIQNIGWESKWSKDGEMSGTQGMAYRLEAIEISLYGEIADYYDVYYRVHAQDYGWLGWAKNGEESGTSGLAKRLEAIQIVLVEKGAAAPGNVGGVSSVTDAISVTPNGNIYSTSYLPEEYARVRCEYADGSTYFFGLGGTDSAPFVSDFDFGNAGLYTFTWEDYEYPCCPLYPLGQDIVITFKSDKDFDWGSIVRYPYETEDETIADLTGASLMIVGDQATSTPDVYINDELVSAGTMTYTTNISECVSNNNGTYTVTIPAEYVNGDYYFKITLSTETVSPWSKEGVEKVRGDTVVFYVECQGVEG